MQSFEQIAQIVKQNRVNHPKKYSQSELSRLLGYKNGQFISNVERGLCSIPKRKVKQLASVLDLDKEELFTAILADDRTTLENYWKPKDNSHTETA